MGEVIGIHRKVAYRATYEETKDQTRWFASFSREDQRHEAHGVIRVNWTALPTTEVRVHATMHLYIETQLSRWADEDSQRDSDGAAHFHRIGPPRRPPSVRTSIMLSSDVL
ncbi:nuclear transport factor 2 (NTF2) superfamily protein [Dyella japonica]|uniref:Nuclear transport factor 2 (NTF2) superfamily protein n=1 Tax=Dyella japonica TaxID=231455 RepID=A0ABV2JNA9_9GAMM